MGGDKSKNEDGDIWHFWNRCFLAREYPRRKIRKVHERGELKPYTCNLCKEKYRGNRFLYRCNKGLRYICRHCYETEKERELLEARDEREKEAIKNAAKFKELLVDCTKLGTCDILAAHHELMVSDDDRLRTDFIMEQIEKIKNSKMRKTEK